MRKSRTSFFLLFGLVASFAPAKAAEPDWERLRQAVRTEMAERHIPGAAIAVVRHDRIVFSEGFGLADVETGRAATAATCFRIGSVTKTLSATLIATLAARGRLDLARAVSTYLPGLPGRLGAPTLDQLLSHQGGLIDRVERNGPAEEQARDAFIAGFRPSDTFAPAGDVFAYSSLGYALAGRTAADSEGLSYAALMDRDLLRPAGMAHSGYDRQERCASTATGYVYRDGRFRSADTIRNAALRPAGLLDSTAEDLGRFARLLLGRGVLDGVRVVPEAAVDMIETPRAPIPGEDRSYGYGLFVSRAGGLRVLSHLGDELGSSSSLTLVPERDVAVIVLVNVPGRLTRSVETALGLVTGEAIALQASEQATALPLGEADFADLPGDYGRYRIYREGGELMIAPKIPAILRSSDLGRRILRFGGDRYAFVPEEAGRPPTRFALVRGADGTVRYLFLRGRSFRRRSPSR